MSELELICKKGDLNEIKKIINDDNIDDIFIFSCGYGHLECAKYLININKNIDIHAYREYAFRWSCENGHFEVAKWLYSFGDVDIHILDEWAFRWSCVNGQSEVAKWLYGLGDVDIHIADEHAFRWSCVNSHFEVAKWLCKICKNYSYRIDAKDNVMCIIKSDFEIERMLNCKKYFDLIVRC